MLLTETDRPRVLAECRRRINHLKEMLTILDESHHDYNLICDELADAEADYIYVRDWF